jgi:DNA-binding transcriptional regulator YiaG
MAYHYTDSGLDNVWLENGYTIHQTPYGEGISIQNTEGLHRAIGEWLIALPKPLSGAELRFLRLEMELTQRDLAGILGADEQAVRRWEKAKSKAINGPADRLLRALYSEYLHGDGSVRRVVDRLAALNQVDKSDVRFRETPKGWQPDECADAA